MRRSGGAVSWCPSSPRCCRSPASRWLSGFIWAAWHYPITAVVYRDADLPPPFWLATFTFVAIAISFAQAWLRLRTGSLWPPIFLHARHNLWMQSIFFPLTSEREYTKWVAGDLGLAFVVVAAVVAVAFWLKRGDLPVDELSTRTLLTCQFEGWGRTVVGAGVWAATRRVSTRRWTA